MHIPSQFSTLVIYGPLCLTQLIDSLMLFHYQYGYSSILHLHNDNLDIFPFSNISVRQVSNLSFNSLSLDRHPNQLRSINSTYCMITNDSQEPVYSKKCNGVVNALWATKIL